MLVKLAQLLTLFCLAVLFLQTCSVLTLSADVFKAICVVGAIAAIVWAVVIL